MKKTITREQVYAAIDSERDYQDVKWAGHSHSTKEYMVYIQHYLDRAFTEASTRDGDRWALEELRKVAALCVAAFEENGIPYRLQKGD